MIASSSPQPSSAHGELVDAFQELHRAAGRLSPRKVSALIKDRDDLPGKISHEGVRTALQGLRVPRWENVHTIVAVLAERCSPPRDPVAEVARFLPLWRAIGEGESGAMKSARELDLGGWGGEDGQWTAELVAGTLLNPYNAIQIHPSLATPHEPLMSEDDWVRVGVRLIEESGAEFALRALLRVLKGDYVGAESGAPFGYENPGFETTEAFEVFRYGCQEILRRLRSEPNLLQDSIRAMRADVTMSRDERAEMLRAESDMGLMREVMTVTPDTWNDVSEEAHHMVFGYLIQNIRTVGRADLPPAERFRITWRVPEPRAE
ncbi:hypothetical protein HYQ63_12190 [Streptomyces sp. Rer75]|nr:hypothetical protein HYQ63_12190 [Streptomyces sp. Rer75]